MSEIFHLPIGILTLMSASMWGSDCRIPSSIVYSCCKQRISETEKLVTERRENDSNVELVSVNLSTWNHPILRILHASLDWIKLPQEEGPNRTVLIVPTEKRVVVTCRCTDPFLPFSLPNASWCWSDQTFALPHPTVRSMPKKRRCSWGAKPTLPLWTKTSGDTSNQWQPDFWAVGCL
jgi:hypothetical protein